MLDIIDIFFNIILYIVDRVVARHWHIRKKYQAFLYKFNAYDFLRIWKRKLTPITYKIEFKYSKRCIWMQHFKYLIIYLTMIEWKTKFYWYSGGWTSWFLLTLYLYYNPQIRDLGPSHDIYDYNPEADMGIYRTIGFILLICWVLWTWALNSTLISIINFFFIKFFVVRFTWRYWYEITIYSFIEMSFVNYISNVIETNKIILSNYSDFEILAAEHSHHFVIERFLKISGHIIDPITKNLFLWFPWSSFCNILTLFGLLYILVFLAIYNTDNVYYNVLYTILLIFLFASTLISLDLDIFAGLLLLIESVVILMLFFLIIYLTPNVSAKSKKQKWTLSLLILLIVIFITNFSYVNFGTFVFLPFSINSIFSDEFYEALNDLFVNDLTGIYINLYWTNSALLVIIGLLLLIASIICVVLVSFFTKLRNSNFKAFLEIFNVVKTCYTFIFLRKQNLAKQGRGVASTKLFNRKTFNSSLHSEYREKQEIFEQKKREEAKQAINSENDKK